MMFAQTWWGALRESWQNIAIGFGIQTTCSYLVLPLFGYHITVSDTLGFGGVMTVVSLARTFLIRRHNEAKRLQLAPPQFNYIMEEIARERLRQINDEGFSLTHDDEHTDGALASAAATYAFAASLSRKQRQTILAPLSELTAAQKGPKTPYHVRLTARYIWPASWSFDWLKITHPRRDLIKSCALAIAEIGRLDRAAAKKGQ